MWPACLASACSHWWLLQSRYHRADADRPPRPCLHLCNTHIFVLRTVQAATLARGRTVRQSKLMFYAKVVEKALQTYERDGWGEFPTQIIPERREIRQVLCSDPRAPPAAAFCYSALVRAQCFSGLCATSTWGPAFKAGAAPCAA